jgi:hypothetical protein
MVMSAGRFSTNFVVPADTFTAWRPFEGATALVAPPFTAIVPLVTQLGMRT